MKKLIILFLIIFASCSNENDPQKIIDQVIKHHGGENYNNVRIQFDFRGNQFEIVRNDGKFEYTKSYTDSSGNNIKDVMNNFGIDRYINNDEIDLSREEKNIIDTQVNSVVYFSLLPQPLNDRAVIKKYLGEVRIKAKDYHKIEVTFRQEGGGRDYQDRYIYWVNTETYEMEYFAYFYHVNDGGHRFRKAINTRRIGGILFSDHINYTSDEIEKNVEDYDQVLKEGNLNKVSDVILENVTVEKL